MADSEDGTRLQHPGSSLHTTESTDDLTGNTEGEATGFPVEDGPDGTLEFTDDAASFTDGALETADEVPGDGTAGEGPPHGDADALQTAEYGRESEAARANTADDTPAPRSGG